MADELVPNILQEARDLLVDAMEEQDREVESYAKGMRPYDSRETTPEQEAHIFENMAMLYYPEKMTNLQAMQRYIEEVGAEEAVKMYERVYRYYQGQRAPEVDGNVAG